VGRAVTSPYRHPARLPLQQPNVVVDVRHVDVDPLLEPEPEDAVRFEESSWHGGDRFAVHEESHRIALSPDTKAVRDRLGTTWEDRVVIRPRTQLFRFARDGPNHGELAGRVEEERVPGGE
jgi:hypothetical protein